MGVKLEHELKSELAKITDFKIDSEKNGTEFIFQACTELLEKWSSLNIDIQAERNLNCQLINKNLTQQCDIDAFVQELNFERENLVKTSNLCRNLEKKIEDLKNDQNSAQRHVQALEKMIRDNKEEKFKLVKKNEGLQHKLSRKSKELEYFAEEKHSLIEKLENLTFENSEYKKSIANLNEEIDHFKSEEYHMEVALPYTLEVAKKQGRINELENHLNNLLLPNYHNDEISDETTNKGEEKDAEKMPNIVLPENCDSIGIPNNLVFGSLNDFQETLSEPSTPFEHISPEECYFDPKVKRKSVTKF